MVIPLDEQKKLPSLSYLQTKRIYLRMLLKKVLATKYPNIKIVKDVSVAYGEDRIKKDGFVAVLDNGDLKFIHGTDWEAYHETTPDGKGVIYNGQYYFSGELVKKIYKFYPMTDSRYDASL